MSLVRASRALFPARLAPATITRTLPATLRYKTTSTAATTPESAEAPHRTTAMPVPYTARSELTDAEPPARPLYPIDHGTSVYSPVPSFPEDKTAMGPTDAAVVSGAPLDLQSRTVRIYKPTKTATQSGNWSSRQWRLDWDVLPRGHRWENPLMGWQSSGDFMQGSHIFFKTKEDAIHFAEKQGYDWFVQEPQEPQFRVKSYAANFLHSPTKLKIVRTK